MNGGALLLAPVPGIVAGLTLRGAGWPQWVLFAVLWVAATVLALRCPLPRRRRTPRRPRGGDDLVHLVCTGPDCGRDLDWAPKEFADRHPAPLCSVCRARVDAKELERPVIVHPTLEAKK